MARIVAQSRDCIEQLSADDQVPYAELLQVLRREGSEVPLVYLVLAECGLVLAEAQAPQPDHDVDDGVPQSKPKPMIDRTEAGCPDTLSDRLKTRDRLGRSRLGWSAACRAANNRQPLIPFCSRAATETSISALLFEILPLPLSSPAPRTARTSAGPAGPQSAPADRAPPPWSMVDRTHPAADLDLHHLGQRDKAPKVIHRITSTDFREDARPSSSK